MHGLHGPLLFRKVEKVLVFNHDHKETNVIFIFWTGLSNFQQNFSYKILDYCYFLRNFPLALVVLRLMVLV